MDRLTHLTDVSELAAEANALSVSGRTRSLRTETTVGLGVVSGRAIMAIGELVLKLVETMRIRRILVNVADNVRGSSMETQTIIDLLELQRIGFYSDGVRQRALNNLIIAMASHTANIDRVLATLIDWPLIELQLFLKQLAAVKLTANSLSTELATIFPQIIDRFLDHDATIVHSTFTFTDMCFLLSGKGAQVLKKQLRQPMHLDPVDIFVSGLGALTTDTRTHSGACTMVSYMRGSPRDDAYSLIQHLAARIGMKPQVSFTKLEFGAEHRDSYQYFQTLLGIAEFILLLTGGGEVVQKELLAGGVVGSLVEVSQGLLAVIDKISARETAVLLSLCIALHRMLLKLHAPSPKDNGAVTEVEGDAMGQSVEDEFASTFDSEKDPGPSQGSPIFGSCASSLRRKVIDMLIRAIIKRGSSKDTLNDFDHQMYAHTFDLLRNPKSSSNARDGWYIVLCLLYFGHVQRYILRPDVTPDDERKIQSMVIYRIYKWRLKNWRSNKVNDSASIWVTPNSDLDRIRQTFTERFDSLITCDQWKLTSLTSERVLSLLSIVSVSPEEVFVECIPLATLVRMIQDESEELLGPFLSRIVSTYRAAKSSNRNHWRMNTTFTLLAFVIRSTLPSSEIYNIFERHDLLDLLKILWQHSITFGKSGCQQIRVWIVVALGIAACHSCSADQLAIRCSYIADKNLPWHDNIREAVKINPIVWHLLVSLPSTNHEESTMISGHILVEPLSDVIPVIVASKWILEALVLCEAPRLCKLHGTAMEMISTTMELFPCFQRNILVSAIEDSPYLREHLTTILSNVAGQGSQDGTIILAISRARAAVYLLRIIQLAAEEDVKVAKTLWDARKGLTRVISRFEAMADRGLFWPFDELQRRCKYFQINLSDFHHSGPSFAPSVPHPMDQVAGYQPEYR